MRGWRSGTDSVLSEIFVDVVTLMTYLAAAVRRARLENRVHCHNHRTALRMPSAHKASSCREYRKCFGPTKW